MKSLQTNSINVNNYELGGGVNPVLLCHAMM